MKKITFIIVSIRIIACLLALALIPGLLFAQAAGEPAKKSKLDMTEEEESPPPKKSKLDEEEEVPAKKPAGKSPVTEPPSAKKTPSPSSTASVEEEEQAERVCDLVFLNQTVFKVRLFEMPLKLPVPSDEREKVFRLPRLPEQTDKEKALIWHSVRGSEITGVRYYEDRMWQKAAEAMKITPQRLAEPNTTFDISTPEKLDGANKAEQMLVTAIAEHDSAVQANKRKGTEWESMRQRLLQSLLNIRLSRADLLLAEGKLQDAEHYCDKILLEFRDASGAADAVRTRFERLFLTQATQAAQRGRQAGNQESQASAFAETRRLLDELQRRYPRASGGLAREFRDGLINEAQDLMKQAEALPPEKAKPLLYRARLIWPALPGLEPRIERAQDEHRVLTCAYTSLPANFAPMLARTPVERHASSLLFEGLVRWWEDDHYQPQLAQGRPVPLPRGRQFYLHEARWSDSSATEPHLVTFADVFSTVKLLSNPKLSGHLPAWAQLIRGDVQPHDNDPFTACIWLHRDHWQPLSLMDFKVLPQRSFTQGTQAELDAFNKSPIGTGPYMLGEPQDANQVRFVANPHYRQPGKPHINEIVFHRLDPTTAVNQFLQREIHLLYDVQPEHVAVIRQSRRTVKTIRSHSVWFLAPRYGSDSQLGKDANLRLAIAHGIDREAILNQYFRAGNVNSTDHVALTGPFPKNSWAYSDESMEFSHVKAQTFASTARKNLMNIRPLRLAFPAGDPITEMACAEIKNQLEDPSIGLSINLVKVTPAESFADTLDDGNFDLAYWRHDFKDQTYWLWPLLDPQGIGPGGPNFMRYPPDADLRELFTQLNSHKQFPQIKELMHGVHRHIFKNAIVIPLWQLDTYVGVDDALKNVRLDPWVLYGNVEEWDLQLRK